MLHIFQPGYQFWQAPYQTPYERQMSTNATIAMFAQQFYSQSYLLNGYDHHLGETKQMADLKSLTDCLPIDYRCSQLRKQCIDPDALYDNTYNK